MKPLRIALAGYRNNPHSGGQGVYLNSLALALKALGHKVTLITGPPGLSPDPQMDFKPLTGLDLYNPADPFRMPSVQELKHPLNLLEWADVSTMGFPEPMVFGLRLYHWLRRHLPEFDILHDNQGLSYGIWGLSRLLPTVITIHHPITVDCRVAVKSARGFAEKLRILRWYSFLGMQRRVARRIRPVITVSQASRADIVKSFGLKDEALRVVPNGVDTRFYPLPDIRRRPNRIIVTNSADMPLKGLTYFMGAVARVLHQKPIEVTIIGQPKKNGIVLKTVRQLGIEEVILFTGRIGFDDFRRYYAEATMAVIPSVYEGFGLPALEAMACGVPVISTSGGALPEVVGDAGVLVPPGDAGALAAAILDLLADPAKAARLGERGLKRVQTQFSWQHAARKTEAVYREAINAYR